MSEQDNLDIGRVVGLIMENPQLIEQISALSKGQVDRKEEVVTEPVSIEEKTIEESTPTTAQPTYNQNHDRVNRAHLLGALKPYVSKERAKAIDSMISIADILDMMRTR